VSKNKKKNVEQGGLQTAKLSVAEKEELKAEKQRAKKREAKQREKGEKRPNIFRRMGTGLKNMGGELKKVRWPSFSRTVTQTGVVLAVVLIFGLVVFGIDRGLAALYDLLISGLGGENGG